MRARIRFIPNRSPSTRDLNRNFPKTNEKNETAGVLAEAVWNLSKQCKPDWLLDLHEGSDFHQINKKSVGSSIIPTKGEGMEDAVQKALDAVNRTIDEPKKKLVRLRYPVDGSLARAAHERLGVRSMILETTVKGQPLSRRARQHRIMVHAILSHLEMTTAGVHVITESRKVDREGSPPMRIAIYDAGGTGGSGVRRLEAIYGKTGGTLVRRLGPPEIQSGALRQFDLVVFPGGSGSRQAAALEKEGRGAIRKFVEAGGGYLGVCAGSYLAADNYSWSLGIVDAKTIDTKNGHWRRGEGKVRLFSRIVARRPQPVIVYREKAQTRGRAADTARGDRSAPVPLKRTWTTPRRPSDGAGSPDAVRPRRTHHKVDARRWGGLVSALPGQ